ncbi:MAG: DUF1636 domain-containing protein [Pseudomonadota bacterium]
MGKPVLAVCTTCRAGLPVEDGVPRMGARLHAALAAEGSDAVEIREVECLSVCGDGVTIALSSPGRWSYVYGRLDLDHVPDILDGAARYAATPDGLVPWRERPEVFRKNSVARIPPQEAP